MKGIDLVISGCDFSGTSTQIAGIMSHLKSKGKVVRDLRGSETDAMFHAESLKEYNQDYTSLGEFLKNNNSYFGGQMLLKINKLIRKNSEFGISSMVKNDVSEFINPSSADFWIMEEPTKRGAGQNVRGFELYRSKFGGTQNNLASALAGQAYRSEEFFRFRKILREKGIPLARSRSEESCGYQIQDEEGIVREGIPRKEYISLPGHQVAFGNPPTHIFLVVGPENWKPNDYVQLRRQRTDGRIMDDNEKAVGYQLLVNKRYSGSWIDELYGEACKKYGSKVPEITRFNIYDSIEEINNKMIAKLEEIMSED